MCSAALLREEISTAINWAANVTRRAETAGTSAEAILKAAGIALASEFAADICRDMGESGLAQKVELAERVLLTAMCVPFAAKMLDGIAAIP